MHRWELERCQDRRGLEVGQDGQDGAGEATGAASVRLLGLLADRLLCHHEPQALLLRVVVKDSSAGQ